MKSLRIALPSMAAAVFLLPASLSAQIINIDFLSQRAKEPTPAPNYVDQGAVGGGTTFNGLTASDLGTNSSGSNAPDYITVSETDLVTAADAATTVGFTISGVGADNQPGSTAVLPNDGYLFLQAGNNTATSANFTISGLGSATEATLYFYTSDYPAYTTVGFTLPGGTQVTYSGSVSPFTTANTIEFEDVPIVAGSITGTWHLDAGDTNPGALSGLTIDVPEPSAWAMIGLGAVLLLWRLRGQNAAI